MINNCFRVKYIHSSDNEKGKIIIIIIIIITYLTANGQSPSGSGYNACT